MDIPRLLAYDGWANREALAALRMTGRPPPRSVRLMGHIIGAQWLWLSRLKQDGKAVRVWPELTPDECEVQLGDLRRHWQSTLSGLTPTKLAQIVAYTNTKGEPWENTVQDILMHVLMHSAYHRGQIATDVRASGHTPAYTDFIHCIRRRYVE
ncbi:MAG: DinB family protein [Terriglobia bacterium]